MRTMYRMMMANTMRNRKGSNHENMQKKNWREDQACEEAQECGSGSNSQIIEEENKVDREHRERSSRHNP